MFPNRIVSLEKVNFFFKKKLSKDFFLLVEITLELGKPEQYKKPV